MRACRGRLRYGSGRSLYAPALSAVTITSNGTPTRWGSLIPSSATHPWPPAPALGQFTASGAQAYLLRARMTVSHTSMTVRITSARVKPISQRVSRSEDLRDLTVAAGAGPTRRGRPRRRGPRPVAPRRCSRRCRHRPRDSRTRPLGLSLETPGEPVQAGGYPTSKTPWQSAEAVR